MNTIKKPFYLTHVGWRTGKKVQPIISIFPVNESTKERIELTPGLQFDLSVLPEHICIGYERSRAEWQNCAFHPNILEKGLQCINCLKLDFYSCRKTCRGDFCNPKTLSAKALCDLNETSIYLTYIGEFKVGVSLNPMRRWLDQGSLFSTVIWKGNGLTARYHEQRIASLLKIKTAITSDKKIALLGKKWNKDKILKKFAVQKKKIRSEYLSEELLDQEIIDLRTYYGETSRLPTRPIKEEKRLKGTVVGVIGSILVLKQRKTYYAINLKKLIGKKFIPGANQKEKSGRQRSLLDFQ